MEQGWQPIVTAPRDGTRVLWCGDNGPFARRRWTYSVIWRPAYRECFAAGHWMPLPAPPQAEAGS